MLDKTTLGGPPAPPPPAMERIVLGLIFGIFALLGMGIAVQLAAGPCGLAGRGLEPAEVIVGPDGPVTVCRPAGRRP